MCTQRLGRVLSQEFVVAGRTYALDLISSLILFFCAAVMAGRVWRFPFDDELITLTAAEDNHSTLELLSFFLKGGDIHPPLSFLFFYFLKYLGLSEAAMRFCSLAMTAFSLALFHLLSLTLMGQRTGTTVRPATRLIAALLFGLSPLAVSQGDAIRWYPLFAMLFSLFFMLYLVAGNEATRLASAVPLGLAASTNFLAAVVIIPFVLYRYFLERQFRLSFESAYWLLFTIFASLGLCSAYFIVKNSWGAVAESEFGNSFLRAMGTHVLGFFGGNALGVSQAWVIIPVVLITAFAMFSEIDPKRPANPVHLFLLMFGAMALMVLPGFGKPRSFLYLSPILAAILTLFLDQRATDRNVGRTTLLASLILIASVGAIANINHGSRPFKRNAVIPFQEILNFIRTNEKGDVLIVSTDPVVVWELRHRGEQRNHCVSYFAEEVACLASERHYDSVFVVLGHSDRSQDGAFMKEFETNLSAVIAGRRKLATLHAGLDEDAALKRWLTHVQLNDFILSVDLYQ